MKINHRYKHLSQLLVAWLVIGFANAACAQNGKLYELTSPNKKLSVKINVGKYINWSVAQGGTPVIQSSAIALRLRNETLGQNAKVAGTAKREVNTEINTRLYKKAVVKDQFNELTINFKGGFKVLFRAYNEGAAYRFVLNRPDSVTVLSEQADFNFKQDPSVYYPYVFAGDARDKYQSSFENTYTHKPLSGIIKDSLAFLPLMVELPEGRKVVITEADLEDYPGMYLKRGEQTGALAAEFAPYPKQEVRGGYNKIQLVVTARENYTARVAGNKALPWRLITVSEKDHELLNNDMVYKLASPSRLADQSWIKPGKIAWDWWNAWNISKVDFRAGINTETYKYYIDFAAANKLEYVLLDDGWSEKGDIMKTVSAIDLPEIVAYAANKNVGIWLWAGMYTINEKMDEAFEHYSKMGIKGFKIDFLNRDDQKMVNFYYKAARKAAARHLMVDFHGAYKPTGLSRTYPNVLNFEGVFGIENFKGIKKEVEFPEYENIVPYVRMLAGSLDFTPGAMRNATRKQYRTVPDMPMSQGTRAHQVALYVVYEEPLCMLADNPTVYMKEQETTDFIAAIPTVFDETIALDGKVGEYTVIARRKGKQWFIAALNNWDARDLEIDLSPLGTGNFSAALFKDGINADRDATDYKEERATIGTNKKMKIHLAPGGGWAARLSAQ